MSGSNFGLAPPVVVNPLQAQTTALDAAGKVYDLRQAQSKEAAGQAFQNSLNPDGTPNQNAFLSNLKANPAAAMSALEASKGGQELDANTYKLHTERLSRANDAVGTLIGRYPNGIPKEAAHAAIQQELDSGLITPQVAQSLRPMFGDNPQQNSIVATQLYTHNMNTAQQLEQRYGTRQQVNAGGTIQFPVVPPASQGGPGPVVPLSMTPGERGKLVEATIQTPQGPVKINIPYEQAFPGQVAPQTPSGQQNPPGTPPVGTVPPNPNAPEGTQPGRVRPPEGSPLRNPNAQPSSPVIQTPSGPALVTSAPPGQTEAGSATGTASAGMATELTKRADQVPTNKANYANMLTDLEKLGSMGPGTERETAINAFLQKATGYGLTMTREQVAAANSFAKLANIAVGQQLAALGGTDARQALFMGSNPNLDLSKLGNQQIIHMLQGNEDAIAAKSRAWQDWLKSGNGPDTYGQFQNDFNHHFDPRVFQTQYMGPDEITALRKSLRGPGEAQKFKDDFSYAKQRGWVK